MATDRSRVSRATLTRQLEDALRTDILEGVLAPGHRIRATDMAERYGVSATPFREALQRLAAENLIEIDPRLGATVSSISGADLQDLYEMLELLDCLALERSMERGGSEWIADVEQRFETLAGALVRQESVNATDDETRRLLGAELAAAHWEFHQALYAACGSSWLLRFIAILHDHAERYRMLARQPRAGRRRDSRGEHEIIMLAAQAGHKDAAVAALRQHLALTVELLRDVVKDHEPT